MDRRDFFGSLRKKETIGWKYKADISSLSTGLKTYKGKWTEEQVVHLLKRTMFGAREEDVHYFKKKKLKKALKELLDPSASQPSPPVNNYNDPDTKKEEANYYVDEEVPAGATWIDSKIANGKNNGRRKNSFKSWWLGLMLNQDKNLREKMVLFWHNHFATETNTVDNAIYVYKHNALLRTHALGNFKEMVKAISIDPAMLRYLNGYASTKKAPDENYGRELQELFTVGKGPASKYTENDVKAAAKVLTGYKLDNKTFSSSFDPSRHDESDKQFSGFYNNTIIKGRKKEEGAQELDDLINMIFSQEEVSKFICRKLYRYFVYHTIDAATEQQVIIPLAAIFRKNEYEIRPVLDVLLSSEHFFDKANYGSIIKSPVDLVVGLCREFKLDFPADSEFMDQYGMWEQLRNQAASMQQNIGDPPNVAGWQAYYQEPQYDKLWISSDTLPKRNQFTTRMLNNGFTRSNKKIVIDTIALARSLPDPANPDALIADSIKLLFALPLNEPDRQFIKREILLSGLTNMQADHYWTDIWNAFVQKQEDKKNANIVSGKLKNMYKYLMSRPEYQLC